MELKEKTAIVTGAGVRLGREIALALAAMGVRVAVHYNRSREPAAEVAREIRAGGGEALVVAGDFGDPVAAAAQVVGAVREELGAPDILINSAAIFEPGSLATTDEEHWDHHFSINLKAPFFLCRAFAADRRPERRGHIVNLGDWRARRPRTGFLAYTLTKSALLTLTESLALELAPAIQVNALALGAILPPPDEDEAYLDRLAEKIPLRRTGSPEEVVEAITFLLRSDFITGEILYLTGGEHL